MRKKRADSAKAAGRGKARTGRAGAPAQRGGAPDVLARELRKANRELSGMLRAAREQQRRVERERADYADLFDFAPVTYALLDAVGLIVKVNAAACVLLDRDRAHLIGHPLLPFVIREDRRELLEHLRRCRTGSSIVESEVRFSSRDGRPVTCRLYSKRAAYEGREAIPTLIADQTERLALDQARVHAEHRRVRAEREAEAARAASAAKDGLLATVSHELRTPLTPALLAASRLAAWDGLPGDARALAESIRRNVELEARLIDDLLDVARIDRDRIALELETVDLHQVVEETVGICRAGAELKGVVFVAQLGATSRHVEADRRRLRQVVWNLLDNAIKFTAAGGSVVVSTTNTRAGRVRVGVRDSGAGMDATELESLFAPFERHPQGHPSRGGLGLGLSICQGLVAAHGGQLWAASEGPGRGSTFAVELATVAEPPARAQGRTPLAEASAAGDARAQQEEVAVVAANDGRNHPHRRILIVEDDRDSAELIALFLSHHGYEVGVASTLADGLGRLAEGWDVVLSDLGLPDGSGLDIARRARQLEHPPRRLVAFTGHGFEDDVERSRNAGFDEHVVKPVELDRLLHALAALDRSP